MELLIINREFTSIGTVDKFESLIWTDRYNGFGDFELSTYVDRSAFEILTPDNYVWISESNKVMIIEDIQITSDKESGNRLIITGRSLESILERRIVWTQTILSGNLQLAVKRLLDENIIAATDTTRRISNFIFEMSSDVAITSLSINAQFTGDNLYEVITSICEAYGLGFEIRLSDTNEFVFKLYAGADRSYDQIENPYVVFSPEFNNILNSNYIESKKQLKTLTLVAGEGEGVDRRTTAVDLYSATGLDRRELFTDARDVSSTTDGDPLTNEEYLDLLIQRGLSALADKTLMQSFEGQMESINTFEYGVDFYLGDIVQMANEYGIESRVRIMEIIRSQNVSGIEVYPTFVNI